MARRRGRSRPDYRRFRRRFDSRRSSFRISTRSYKRGVDRSAQTTVGTICTDLFRVCWVKGRYFCIYKSAAYRFFAICLLLAAVVGKLFCAVAAFESGLNRIAIGIGMAPRGELTLVFASIGMTLMLPNTQGVLEPVISPATFGVYVFIAMVTAFLTPPALKWALSRKT